MKDRLTLILGAKLEHHDFSGFQFQPNGRLTWIPHEHHTVWAAVSRAVRTPSRRDREVNIVARVLPGNIVVRSLGNPDFKSEKLTAYELGYRVLPHKRLALDLATFYNVYDRLRSNEPQGLAILAGNKLDGETYGVELAAQWEVTDWWRLRPAYTFLEMQLHTKSGSLDTVSERRTEGESPHHQFSLQSMMDLPRQWELDSAIRYVDALPALMVPNYVALDVRLGWRPSENWEISIMGQNLLDNRHPEFSAGFGVPGQIPEVERSVYGKLVWRF